MKSLAGVNNASLREAARCFLRFRCRERIVCAGRYGRAMTPIANIRRRRRMMNILAKMATTMPRRDSCLHFIALLHFDCPYIAASLSLLQVLAC